MRLMGAEVFCMRGSDLLRRIPALASIFLVMTMTAGCWDAIDIDKRAFVSVMGLDSADSDEGGRIQVTLIIPTLGGEGGGGAGGGGGGAGTPETMPARALVLEQSGANVEEAVEKMRAMVGGVLDLSTLQYVAVGRGMNPNDLMSSMHTLHFTRFVPMTPLMFATEEKVSDLFSVASPSGRGLTDTLDAIQAQSRIGWGHIHYPQSWEIMILLVNKTGDMTLTVIDRADQGDGLQAVGAAVYDGAECAGLIDPSDALMLYSVAYRRYPGGSYPFAHEGRGLLMRVMGIRTSVKASRGADDAPRLTVDMRADATLMDSGGYRLPLLNRKKLDELEQTAARDMEARLGRLLERLQGWNSDAMRLYHEVRVRMPEMSYEDFKEVYPRIKVDFNVSVLLVRTGLLR